MPPFCVKSHAILILGLLFYFGGTHAPDAFWESKHEAEGYVCETSHVCNFIYLIASLRGAWSLLFLTISGVHPCWLLVAGFSPLPIRFWFSLVWLFIHVLTFWDCIAVLSSQSHYPCGFMLLIKCFYCNAILMGFWWEQEYPQVFHSLNWTRREDCGYFSMNIYKDN